MATTLLWASRMLTRCLRLPGQGNLMQQPCLAQRGRGREEGSVEADRNGPPLLAWSCLGSAGAVETPPLPPRIQPWGGGGTGHTLALCRFHLLSSQGPACSRQVLHVLGTLGGHLHPQDAAVCAPVDLDEALRLGPQPSPSDGTGLCWWIPRRPELKRTSRPM